MTYAYGSNGYLFYAYNLFVIGIKIVLTGKI
jgi:hypothetical protein